MVALYLLATVAIGVYANRQIHTVADYLIAGRSLKSSIAIVTMLGSEIGLIPSCTPRSWTRGATLTVGWVRRARA